MGAGAAAAKFAERGWKALFKGSEKTGEVLSKTGKEAGLDLQEIIARNPGGTFNFNFGAEAAAKGASTGVKDFVKKHPKASMAAAGFVGADVASGGAVHEMAGEMAETAGSGFNLMHDIPEAFDGYGAIPVAAVSAIGLGSSNPVLKAAGVAGLVVSAKSFMEKAMQHEGGVQGYLSEFAGNMKDLVSGQDIGTSYDEMAKQTGSEVENQAAVEAVTETEGAKYTLPTTWTDDAGVEHPILEIEAPEETQVTSPEMDYGMGY